MRADVAALAIAVVLFNVSGFVMGTGLAMHQTSAAQNRYATDSYANVVYLGGFIEVSKAQWSESRSQGFNLALVFPVTMLVIGLLLFRLHFPRVIFHGPRAAREQIERKVRDSGAPQATIWCAGRLGRVSFRGPLLRVTVHPAGLRVKPLLLPAFAIRASEITAVEPVQYGWLNGIELTHAARHVVSPLILYRDWDDPFRATLEATVRSARR
jgi:hypothetical protein